MERKTETKKLIKEAFTKLLSEKGFNNLTVSDITRKAGINRGTFYLHYIDKYDLLEKLENDAINDLRDILLNNPSTKSSNLDEIFPYNDLVEALNYAKNDYEFVANLASENGDPKFNEKFKMILTSLLKSRINLIGKTKSSKLGIPSEYIYEILVCVPIAIILMWIRNGCVESPTKIAKIISATRDYAPSDFIKLN